MIGSDVRGLYTVIEAARLLGVGRSTMYELVRRGDVSSLRLGRKVLITRATLEALLGFPPPTCGAGCALAGEAVAVGRRSRRRGLYTGRRQPGCRWSRWSLTAARHVEI